MAAKIRSGDNVMVISGKDKGKVGKVLRVVHRASRSTYKSIREDDRTLVLVEGINTIKKHVRPNPEAGIEGGIQEREAPLHMCKVMLVNPSTGKPERVGFNVLGDGRKVRVFKKSGEVVDVADR